VLERAEAMPAGKIGRPGAQVEAGAVGEAGVGGGLEQLLLFRAAKDGRDCVVRGKDKDMGGWWSLRTAARRLDFL